jgi:hypothetical protein
MLSASRDADAAEQFFRKVLDASHTTRPRVITVDQNTAYPPAFEALQHDRRLPKICQLRQCKFLNNLVEQDHRFVKRRVNPGLGFGAFATAQRTIHGYEAMHMIRKGQIEGTAKRDVLAQNRVIDRLFGLAASGVYPESLSLVAIVFATEPTIVTLTKPGGALRTPPPRPRGIMWARVPGRGRWRMRHASAAHLLLY